MRLLEQFRVRATDGTEHTVACWQDSFDRPSTHGFERIAGRRLYRINGNGAVEAIDADTFRTASGELLRRV